MSSVTAAAPALLEACKAVLAVLEQPAARNLHATNAIVAGDLAHCRAWLENAINKAEPWYRQPAITAPSNSVPPAAYPNGRWT